MPEVESSHPETPLAEICAAAAEFGLPPSEIWEAVVYTLCRLPRGVPGALRSDELAGALARRLLELERERMASAEAAELT